MKPLDTWNAIKQAAARDTDLGTGLAKIALDLWASHDAHTKVGHTRATREAFVASVVGAAVVDVQIEKLALDRSDKAYLLNLNAVAALEDLSQFTKSAGMLDFLAKHPAAVGAVIGGAGGAGFGAYADDENRLRGAVRFGVPGAIGGAMIGHGIHQMKAEGAEKAKTQLQNDERAAREVESHASQQAANKAREQQQQAQQQAMAERAKRESEQHAMRQKIDEHKLKQEEARTAIQQAHQYAAEAKAQAAWNQAQASAPAAPPPAPAASQSHSQLQSLQGALSTP